MSVTRMYQRHGYEAEDAFIHARVLYFTQIGHYALEVDDDLETRQSHLAAYLRSFSEREPTEEEIEDFRRFTFGQQAGMST